MSFDLFVDAGQYFSTHYATMGNPLESTLEIFVDLMEAGHIPQAIDMLLLTMFGDEQGPTSPLLNGNQDGGSQQNQAEGAEDDTSWMNPQMAAVMAAAFHCMLIVNFRKVVDAATGPHLSL